METNKEIQTSVRKLKPLLRIGAIIFWIVYALYLVYALPGAWYNPNYSHEAILLLGVLPSGILIVLGIIYPMIYKVVITDEYILSKALKSSKLFYKDVLKVDVGPNYIKLYETKKRVLTISCIYEEYEEIKKVVLEKLESSDVEIAYKKRYRS